MMIITQHRKWENITKEIIIRQKGKKKKKMKREGMGKKKTNIEIGNE